MLARAAGVGEAESRKPGETRAGSRHTNTHTHAHTHSIVIHRNTHSDK